MPYPPLNHLMMCQLHFTLSSSSANVKWEQSHKLSTRKVAGKSVFGRFATIKYVNEFKAVHIIFGHQDIEWPKAHQHRKCFELVWAFQHKVHLILVGITKYLLKLCHFIPQRPRHAWVDRYRPSHCFSFPPRSSASIIKSKVLDEFHLDMTNSYLPTDNKKTNGIEKITSFTQRVH